MFSNNNTNKNTNNKYIPLNTYTYTKQIIVDNFKNISEYIKRKRDDSYHEIKPAYTFISKYRNSEIWFIGGVCKRLNGPVYIRWTHGCLDEIKWVFLNGQCLRYRYLCDGTCLVRDITNDCGLLNLFQSVNGIRTK